MKEQILRLRQEGKTYNEICDELGCSKGTVSYHCGEKQKDKSSARARKRRQDIVIVKKVENFQFDRRMMRTKSDDFQRERIKNSRGFYRLGKRNIQFTWRDVIEKFGWETHCYLTGRPIKLKEPRTYQFDHITPVVQGGDSSLNNLGLACKDANQAKSHMTVEEFVGLCKEVLEHNGYEVKKIET